MSSTDNRDMIGICLAFHFLGGNQNPHGKFPCNFLSLKSLYVLARSHPTVLVVSSLRNQPNKMAPQSLLPQKDEQESRDFLYKLQLKDVCFIICRNCLDLTKMRNNTPPNRVNCLISSTPLR